MVVRSSLLCFLAAYGAAMLLAASMHRIAFRWHPAKARRYEALPLRYKRTCRFLVLPTFAGGIFHEGFFLLGLIFFFVLESACVRWYRSAGLY
jgi:hypothetical protein